MKTKKLRGGVLRCIHVLAPNLVKNLTEGTNLPTIGVRLASKPHKMIFGKPVHNLTFDIKNGVQLPGMMGTMQFTPKNPLPGTGGRAVCVLRTTLPLICEVDD